MTDEKPKQYLWNGEWKDCEPQPQAAQESDLTEARLIFKAYAQKCSTVDEGNLYFAGTQFEKAYIDKCAEVERLKIGFQSNRRLAKKFIVDNAELTKQNAELQSVIDQGIRANQILSEENAEQSKEIERLNRELDSANEALAGEDI